MELSKVKIEVPSGFNMILGQSHFIKTVEDIYEALITSSPNIKFGIAFCESSGPALIRYDGNDEKSIELALDIAKKVSAGHFFVIVLNGSYPINVLNRIKMVQEVVTLYCATANPVEVIIAETDLGRGVLGVIDGLKSKGIEDEEEKRKRHEFLRKLGYKK